MGLSAAALSAITFLQPLAPIVPSTGAGNRPAPRGVVPGVDGYTQKDFETIEAAVLESPRGRWFLSEYTRRNRAADTLMLLEAIAKLERGIAEHSPDQVSEELAAGLQGLSQSIGAALDGILQPGDVWEATDDVLIGRVRHAVEQLSEVKRQVDGLLAGRPAGAAAEGEPALTAESTSFFEGDEALFEPAPEAGAAPSPAPVQTSVRGVPAAPPLASSPKAEPKDRIVFIRRASSEETSIPLADEAGDLRSTGQ